MNIGIRSSTQPQFGQLNWRRSHRHIIVLSNAAASLVGRLMSAESAPDPSAIEVLLLEDGQFREGSDMADWRVKSRVFHSVEAMLNALSTTLRTASMSTHVYVAGSDSFIGDVARCAFTSGLSVEALSAEQSMERFRNAQCVHCKTIQRVSTRAFECATCGLLVVVRDHYSRRLAAYQAVMVDPSDPKAGELRKEEL